MPDLKVGDFVIIKEATGRGKWRWTSRKGRITHSDKYCFTVAPTDGGPVMRDQRDHFRPA
jgi:hypothetical protein